MKIRVIGGKYKHRILEQPPLEITRATKDAVKEGVFNSINAEILSKSFLDLFGGSGAIGIEAYSRGAKNVVIVDKDKTASKIIRDNLKSVDINDILVIEKDYKEAYKILKDKCYKFDYVFIDPPYKMKLDINFINELENSEILSKNPTFILETDYLLEENTFNEYELKRYKYGKTYIYKLKKIQN